MLAADKRISAIARELKNRGADASLDVLRAKVYIALLAGQPLDHLLSATSGDGRGPGARPGVARWVAGAGGAVREGGGVAACGRGR